MSLNLTKWRHRYTYTYTYTKLLVNSTGKFSIFKGRFRSAPWWRPRWRVPDSWWRRPSAGRTAGGAAGRAATVPDAGRSWRRSYSCTVERNLTYGAWGYYFMSLYSTKRMLTTTFYPTWPRSNRSESPWLRCTWERLAGWPLYSWKYMVHCTRTGISLYSSR